MLRRNLGGLLFLTASLAHAGIFPEMLGNYTRGPAKEIASPDSPLYQEYGFEASEHAEFTSPDGKFTASAWRFHDSTGAMAALQSQQPVSAGELASYGNYLFLFSPKAPADDIQRQLRSLVPKLEKSPLPVLKDYLPAEGLIPDSPRYIVGPVSLARFEPRISPSQAAFHLSAEAQLGRYSTPNASGKAGPMTLVIFSYPTPNMARDRFNEFQKVPGAVAKRTGTLVAVTMDPPDPNLAETVLAKVVFQQNLTLNEQVPENGGRIMTGVFLGSFILAGAIFVICLVTGVGLGTFRIFLRKLGWKVSEPEQMIVFDIDGRANK